uniref:(E3-independent) E2 ubiquitin-conjugating enzyme n=1 Tax=Tetraodon nigroviridis TaxID=99883 RepID=H3BYF9_TETNG
AKVFSNVQWLSGVKPVLSRKCKFRVVVEEVKVVELKVTWITKSYSPQGSDSVCPPPSSIPQENLCRVRRLGYYDHTQRQLGERALYVFPAKGDATRITCEGPEGVPVLPEDPVARKLKRMFKKCDFFCSHCSGEHKCEHPESSLASNGPVASIQSPPDSQNLHESSAEPGYQDADDEATECLTTVCSSLTSSASSSASSQSGGLATNRKKSIPLSIRNLKRKHKKKRTKFSREFKPGDRVAVEVVSTKTTADVMWKDGHLEKNIRSNDLIPIQHIDTHEFCPGDLVVDKRPPALQDPGLYGVIQSGDHKARTCVVKWVKLNSSSDDVEVLGTEEDVSVYDIADHPDFHFRTSDIVIRIWNSEHEQKDCENGTSIGQVSRVDVSSKVEVVWADNSMTVVLPQHLYGVESEMEETDYDSVEETSSVLSTEEWEDESDSWETDNGLTTEDDCHANSADLSPAENPDPPHLLGSAAPRGQRTQTLHICSVLLPPGAVNGAEKPSKDGSSRGFRELKEALKILESLKNMTVEQLWTGGSPTSPTSAEPASTTPITTPAAAAPAEKPTKEKRFLDDIKKLQNLRKTLDNVAIVEEEKMEAVVAAGSQGPEAERGGEEKLQPEPQTPVGGADWPSEGLSDTPVLCQRTGGKPGVTFTSAKGEVFSVLEWAPDTHSFKKMEFQPAEAKKFFSTVRKEMALLATSLPEGIMVKTFEDRMDLFSALIKGPTRTPYEDGLFLFDIQLPNIYPAVPPLFHYLSQCSGRLNPNLYDNGKVCVSLLGTWIGKGTERWTSKSSLLQVLISIQGLILVNEPYYNEAGFDSDRGLQEGYENSRCYNEMALIKMVQSMTQLLQNPVEVFRQEIQEHFALNGWRLVHRLEAWLDLNDAAEKASARAAPPRAFPVEDHAGAGPVALAHSSPSRAREEVPGPAQGHGSLGAELSRAGGPTPPSAARCPATDSLAAVVGSTASQPAVRPKKRRKSYRSFLPEGSGYPDIGFPLFPVSKGFVKSVGSVLQQYRSALAAAGLAEDK